MRDKGFIITSILLVILLWGTLYFNMLSSIPPFGDSATYASITMKVLENNTLESRLEYPPLFFFFQAILVGLYGNFGLKVASILGVLVISMSIFLLSRKITRNAPISLISMILVLSSTKLISFSSKMYIEIFLSGFIIFTIYLLLLFVEKKSKIVLILLASFTGIAAIIKQQGLFILFPSILAFLFFLKFKNKMTKIRRIIIFIIIFFFIILIPYLFLAHIFGEISPGIGEFKIGEIANDLTKKISFHKLDTSEVLFDSIWGEKLENLSVQYRKIATERSASKQVWPWQPFISWESFIKVNGLYIHDIWSSKTDIVTEVFFGILIIIITLSFLTSRLLKKDILKINRYILFEKFMFFSCIFLVINYIFFIRNHDQTRYHLFLAINLFIISIVGLLIIIAFIKKRTTYKFLIPLIILVLFISLFNLSFADTTSNGKRWSKTQLYSPSMGGIDSVVEIGEWIKENSNAQDKLWQVCGSELLFYANRKIYGDYSYYFLTETELKKIIADLNITYLIILKSQIVKDEEWNNFCWVPQSFEERIKKMYPIAYQSSYGDISVYRPK